MQSSSSRLQAGASRKQLHLRRIEMRGFERTDGLYEVEGRVSDQKTQDLTVPGGGKLVKAHDAIHDMGVALVFDADMVVHEVRTFTDAAPFDECPGGGQVLQALKGARIAQGWSKEVRTRLAGARGCTHLVELLIPLATAAYQTMAMYRLAGPDRLDDAGRPLKIDSCHAYRAEGELVQVLWPAFSKRAGPAAG